MYEMTVASSGSGTPQRRGGWRDPEGRGRGGRDCGGGGEEEQGESGRGREDERRRNGKDENGRRSGERSEVGGRRNIVREEIEARRGSGREEERRKTTGRKEQKEGGRGGGHGGHGGGGLTEQELVRKMEEVTIGQVRRIEVRGSRALFTPQVLPRFHRLSHHNG